MSNNLDKNLIKNNFNKSILTYDKHATIQKIMAKRLVEFLPYKKFKNILEIGAYSGNLTKIINSKIDFLKYSALDIVDTSFYIKKINKDINFIKCDIETFQSDEKYDLIVANASLQWCNDFNLTIKKLKNSLTTDGLIALSIFTDENLYEIKDVFDVGLNYPKTSDIRSLFSKKAVIIKEEYPLKFNFPIEVLRHLKYTGVNSIQKNQFSYKEIKEKLRLLEKKYHNTITYYPLYVID